MGLLEQEIKELRQMNTMLLSGKMKPSDVNASISIYSQTEKRAKMILQAYALSAKFGAKHLKNLSKTQLIGDGSVIDIDTEIIKETIFCSEQGKVITRLECKQYSQTTGNLTPCEHCSNFRTTRRLLASVDGEQIQAL